MQVFVLKNDLATASPVPVIGYYADLPVLARDLHGGLATLLILPLAAIIPGTPPATGSTDPPVPTTLKASFRAEFMPTMCNGEALRRINAVFPDYMQRNANADINRSSMLYGVDSSTWPQDAKDRKAQNDQGWSFVGSVRQTSDALGVQTSLTDPTDDSHWPISPPPIYIPPVP